MKTKSMKTKSEKRETPSDIFRELFGDIPEKSGLILEDVDKTTCRVHTKDGDSFDFEVHSF